MYNRQLVKKMEAGAMYSNKCVRIFHSLFKWDNWLLLESQLPSPRNSSILFNDSIFCSLFFVAFFLSLYFFFSVIFILWLFSLVLSCFCFFCSWKGSRESCNFYVLFYSIIFVFLDCYKFQIFLSLYCVFCWNTFSSTWFYQRI